MEAKFALKVRNILTNSSIDKIYIGFVVKLILRVYPVASVCYALCH